MIPCPKCSRENDDKALYCDQCRTAVSPDVPSAVHKDPCPACGGQVREIPSVMAACGDCGIALGEETHAAGGRRVEGAPEAASSSAEAASDPAEAGPEVPCPVCGEANAAGAPDCAGCLIGLKPSREPRACPKCSAETSEDKCDCGAVLTLAKLLTYVDASVKVVCSLCKQPFTVDRRECSDCGSETLPADALKAAARNLT